MIDGIAVNAIVGRELVLTKRRHFCSQCAKEESEGHGNAFNEGKVFLWSLGWSCCGFS